MHTDAAFYGYVPDSHPGLISIGGKIIKGG